MFGKKSLPKHCALAVDSSRLTFWPSKIFVS